MKRRRGGGGGQSPMPMYIACQGAFLVRPDCQQSVVLEVYTHHKLIQSGE